MLFAVALLLPPPPLPALFNLLYYTKINIFLFSYLTEENLKITDTLTTNRQKQLTNIMILHWLTKIHWTFNGLKRFTHIALHKRVAWVNGSCRSLKKSDVNDSLVTVFPHFMPKSKLLVSLLMLIHSFLKSNFSDSLPMLFTKEQLWAICSGRSWQKSDCERFAQVAYNKRAKGAIRSFTLLT